MPRFAAPLAAAFLIASPQSEAQAAKILRVPAPAGAPPIASAVVVPAGARLVFLSGALAAPDAQGGPTEVQATSALARLDAVLHAQGLSLADVVSATVFLVGDPQKGGAIDFAGLNAAWSRAFGTAAQPNKPARTTVKVAGLVAPGALIEIDAIAARAD